MLMFNYKLKKDLKSSIGKPLCYMETSLFGDEVKDTDSEQVVTGANHPKRSWFANVTIKRDNRGRALIIKVV